MRFLRIFGLSFITGFSGAMMPGPLLALTIGQVAAVGFSAVIWLMVGHAALEIIVVLMMMAGLRPVLQRPAVRSVIGIVGGLALLYMGFDMVRSAPTVALDIQGGQSVPWLWLIVAGAAVCAQNPYFIGWWATIGVGQLAHLSPRNAGEWLTFYLGHELSDFTWYAFVGVLVLAGGHFLSGSWYQWLVGVCGVLIGVLALWFIYTGITIVVSTRRAELPRVSPVSEE